MSGDTLYAQPLRRQNVSKTRVHDYLYDPAFIVSGARDYARTAFKAAMASAQVVIQPQYCYMFSELRQFPSAQLIYHPNCRLPDHIDPSYAAYLERLEETRSAPNPDFEGKDRFKYIALPKKVLPLKSVSPDFQPPSKPAHVGPTKPRNRGTQSVYRESSAQTIPWQPDAKAADTCEKTPEVLYLDKLEWGPGRPYRIGDLPADFHTTEIINKLRHARVWTDLVEKASFPRWLKKRDQIITDIETKDWIFRETEIDELQSIRLELLHRLQAENRTKQTNKTSHKLAKLWSSKKKEMERKIDQIRRASDREHRKLVAIHEGGGRAGVVARLRAARGHGAPCTEAVHPTSDLHAPVLRHGYQARRRHATIYYDPSLLSEEDHNAVGGVPAWVETCHNLGKSCSGHHLVRDPKKPCERETKWSEQFLENLHNDLKKARLGAALNAVGPLHVLKPRRPQATPRPETPQVPAVDDAEEAEHQAALVLQKVIKGRAVQCLMYEGRTRAAELTEELKTTHGLQREDKIRIAREESKAREYNARRTETEQRDDAITALVDELCGGAMSAALDFLEKELRRLKDERRQHAFILVALREKLMREAAEAGRRQKEEHRRREHDEMFKQVLGVTQGTVDAYLQEIITEGVELAAELDAVNAAKIEADKIEKSIAEHNSMSTAEQNELVADLVQQFLLPHAHRTAARHHINKIQNAKLEATRAAIFGLLDEAEIRSELCPRCGRPPDDFCHCLRCKATTEPVETVHRHDPRWKYQTMVPTITKSLEERYPLTHETRCLLNALLDDVVAIAQRKEELHSTVERDIQHLVNDHVDAVIDARELSHAMVDVATGDLVLPVKKSSYKYLVRRVIPDALERSEPYTQPACSKELPSEIRRRAKELKYLEDPYCHCGDPTPPEPEEAEKEETKDKTQVSGDDEEVQESVTNKSTLRLLEQMLKCKCDEPHLDEKASDTDLTEDSDFTDYDRTTPEEKQDEV